jgi:MFS family permease
VGSVSIIPQWFDKQKSFANAIASAGSGLGGLIWCLVTGRMIPILGHHWSLRITAIVAFTVNFTCALLMKDRNKQINPYQRAFDFGLLRRYEFLLLIAWGIFSLLGYTILLFALPTQSLSLGFSQSQAALIGAMVNLGMAIGRPIIGYFSDRVGRINMALGGTFFGALVCFFIWVFARSLIVLIVFAILGGTVCGTFFATIGILATEVLGIRQLPSALSILWTSAAIPCLFATPIAVAMERPKKSNVFLDLQVFTGCMFAGGSIWLALLRNWKIAKNEEERNRNVGEQKCVGEAMTVYDGKGCERESDSCKIAAWFRLTLKWVRV